METNILHSAETARASQAPAYPPLELVTTPGVPTAQAAHYLNRATQTLHIWACRESYPEGLRPRRINGRLDWPVAGLRRVLGVA